MELRKIDSKLNSTRKMHFYSGHDNTINSILAVLSHINEWPDFGASLHFHLYFDNTIGYTIKVWLFNLPILNKLKIYLVTCC